jgi:LuxR family maltose regulon positive regulatory protein
MQRQIDPWRRLGQAHVRIAYDDPGAAREIERCWRDFDRAGSQAGRLCAAAAMCEWMHVQRRDFHAHALWRARLEAAVTPSWPTLDAERELRALVGAARVTVIKPLAGLSAVALARRIIEQLDPVQTRQDVSASLCLTAAAAAVELAGHNDDIAGMEAAVAYATPYFDAADAPARARWLHAAGVAFGYTLAPDPRGLQMFAQGRELAARENLRSALFDLCHEEIFLRLGREGPAGLDPLFEQMLQALDPTRLFDVARRHHLDARRALHSPGHAGNAVYYARTAVELIEQSGYPTGDAAMLYTTYAYACARHGDHAAGLAAMEKVAAQSVGAQHDQQQSIALFLRAYAVLRNEPPDHARALLQQAFAEADRMQWFGFRPVPEVAGQLVEAALRLNIESAPYARKLVDLRKLVPPGYSAAWPWQLRITTLGRFELASSTGPLAASGKVPRKTLELLQYVAGSPQLTVAADRLTAVLWPELEGDLARGAFRTALHRLRKLLDNADAVQFDGASVRLDPAHVWVDALAFERLVDSTEAALRRNDGARARFDGAEALALYAGHFLADQQEAGWILTPQERLRSRFVRLVTMLGEHYERGGAARDAQALYRKAIEFDPLDEEIARRLITLLRDAGEESAALEVYRALRQRLSVVLGRAPSAQTQRLADTLRA